MRQHLAAVAAAFAALVFAAPARADLLIKVDKSIQQMTVSEDGQQLYAWPVSTGVAGYDTPNGAYTPFRKEKEHYSREWDDAPMPYSIFFTMKGHAIHGTNHTGLGHPASHGCVRLSVQHAARLWDLVEKNKMAHTTVVLTGEIPRGAGPPAVARARPQPREDHNVAPQGADGGQYANQGDNRYVNQDANQDGDQYGADQDGDQVVTVPPRRQVFGRNGWQYDNDDARQRGYYDNAPDDARPRSFFPFLFGR
jgi:hypothetical protein